MMRVLHVSDYEILRGIRGSILRQRFTVIQCDSAHALELLEEDSFDAVVFCGSVPEENLLVIAANLPPSVAIARLAYDRIRQLEHLVTISPRALDKLNDSVAAAIFARHAAANPAPLPDSLNALR